MHKLPMYRGHFWRASAFFVTALAGSLCSAQSNPAPLQPSFNGLTGYFHGGASEGLPARSDGWGTTFYSTVYPVKPGREDWTQLGSTTWMVPNQYEDENGVSKPFPRNPDGSAVNFCPPNGILFQSMEGGFGTWGTVQFPTALPMFIINATANCYQSYITGPGYQFTGQRLLAADDLYFAQLSNRLLVPPGPLLFEDPGRPKLFGYGFIALPLIPANMSPYGIPTGRNSWTLFINSDGFKGPLGFFTPAFWTAVNRGQNPMLSVGYGLDTRNAISGSAAVEVGFTQAFTAIDTATNTEYRRIPKITFAADANGRASLVQDFNRYFKTALWNGVEAWVNGSGGPITQFNSAGIFNAVIRNPSTGLRMITQGGGAFVPIDMGTAAVSTVFPTAGGRTAFGIQWDGTAGPSGTLPEYYSRVGSGNFRPIPASQVPASTRLTEQTFPTMRVGTTPALDVSANSPWDSRKWAAGPYSTRLGNGSVVDYVWYRFIDQPALARLPLDSATRSRLQTWAESVHSQGLNAFTIPPPSSGELASLEKSQVVTPPSGMTRGFVPIAISQKVQPTTDTRNYSSMYYAPANAGYGVSVTHQDQTAFAVWYTFDTSGRPVWYTALTTRQSNGRYAGSYVLSRGTPLAQINNAPAQLGSTPQGTVELIFDDYGHLDFAFTPTGGATQKRMLDRLPLSATPLNCRFTSGSRATATNYSDLWWNAAESGWGLTLLQQGNAMFVAWYSYADDQAPQWLTSVATRQSDGSFLGRLNRPTSGTAFNREPEGAVTALPLPDVGEVRLRFTNGETGTMAFTVDGTTRTKPITRFAFGTSVQVCESAG